MLFWQLVSKRSRRNSWNVCVCVCLCVDIVKCWGEVHFCVRPQLSLHTSHAFIRRVSLWGLRPSVHPSIHNIPPLSFALLPCRFSRGRMGVNTDGWGLFTVTDGTVSVFRLSHDTVTVAQTRKEASWQFFLKCTFCFWSTRTVCSCKGEWLRWKYISFSPRVYSSRQSGRKSI